MTPHEHAVFRFGDFVLVPSERLLLRDGKPLALTGKAFDLLVALVRNAEHLLTKDELLHAVWPGVVVEEVNLSVNVSALRKVLGPALDGEWIETVPRQGYRFNAAVEVGDVATAAQVGLSLAARALPVWCRCHRAGKSPCLSATSRRQRSPAWAAPAGSGGPKGHRTLPSPCCHSPSTTCRMPISPTASWKA